MASPDGGVYNSAQNVALSTDESATIYYTANGTDPTETSNVYTTPITITDSTMLKFFAKDLAGNKECIKTETYNITPIMKGDINGNHAVNLIDGILAMRVISGTTPIQPVYKRASVRGDDKIGLEDVIYIFQIVADLREIPANWNIKQNGNIIEIYYGSGTDYPQYAALDLESSYFRLNYGSTSGWGTSIILLPSFWEAEVLYQGAPIKALFNTDGADIIINYEGTLSHLNVNGQLRIAPPSGNSISATVSAAVNGDAELSSKTGEAFKPVMLSSMHISSAAWDAKSAYVDSQVFQIPQSGWIIQPPVMGKVFGLQGGTSTWKNNAPTIELIFKENMLITGSRNTNDDNVGFWAASDTVIPSWQYRVIAKP